MAEDLQSLLAKIQEQGLDKANAERAAIIKKAEQEAAEITAKAKAAADAMRRAAEEECASLTKRAESAVKQAARDIVLKLNVELKERLNAILQENTANAMTPELMGRIINEMAAAYIKDGKQEAKLEVLVSPKSLEEMNAALKGSLKDSFVKQPTLFDMEWASETVEEHDKRIQRAVEIEKKSHTYFAHNTKAMDPTRLIESLNEAKKVIGDIYDTRDFVIGELRHAGINVKVDSIPLCYSFQFIELPENLKSYFQRTVDKKGTVRISFASPTPKNYMYIGRNHTFVEDLSRSVVNDTINGGNLGACRAMVIETDKVDMVTTVLLMRVRSVISETKHNDNQLVGEEMIFFGYKGKVDNHDFISEAECQNLFLDSQPTGDIDLAAQRNIFNRRLEWINNEATLRLHTDDIATERANNLVRSFARYRTYLSEAEYQVVKPILPMDVIAAFVYTPKVSHL